jgi:hypothetical protein
VKRPILAWLFLVLAGISAPAQYYNYPNNPAPYPVPSTVQMAPQYSGYVNLSYDGTTIKATSVVQGITDPYYYPTQQYHYGLTYVWVGYAEKKPDPSSATGFVWIYSNGTHTTTQGPKVDPSAWISVTGVNSFAGTVDHGRQVGINLSSKIGCSGRLLASGGALDDLWSWKPWRYTHVADTFYKTESQVAGTGGGTGTAARCNVRKSCIAGATCQLPGNPAEIKEGLNEPTCHPQHNCSWLAVRFSTDLPWSCVGPSFGNPLCLPWAGTLPGNCFDDGDPAGTF